MPAPVLTEIEEVADDLTGRLDKASSKAVFQLEGASGAGKSVCLNYVADRLQQQTNLKPVIVSPPSRHLDAGAIALADVATGLSSQALLNGELDGWLSGEGPGTWDDRVSDVKRWVEEHNEKVVLLLDDPRSWAASSDDDGFFTDRGFNASVALTSLKCRRVIAGQLPLPHVHLREKIALGAPTIDHDWLEPSDDWGELAKAASELASSRLLDHPLTPLQVRLLIASIALSSLKSTTRWFDAEVNLSDGGNTNSKLVARVAEGVQGRKLRRLWDSWIGLSVTRRPFDQEILDTLIPKSTTRFERDLIRHCLLFGERSLRMHDNVKHLAIRWRGEHRNESHVKGLVSRTTRELFKIYKARFDRELKRHGANALRESLEAYHFASTSGDSKLFESVRPVFVDQLDALGWSLSVQHHNFKGAASAFEQALKWDERDDYAHHYLAYNLDRVGKRLKDVEFHYRKAARLKPQHPWWRSRLIKFLIGRGRIGEARSEWDTALLELQVGEGDSPTSLYEHLHFWVAAALLDAGEPSLAQEVLDEVPTYARSGDFSGLYQRAQALLQVGEGDAVVPAWRLHPGWWREDPERLQYRFPTGERLMKWLAARVESKSKNGTRLRGALVEGDKEPEIVWLTVSDQDFAAWCQDNVDVRDLRVGAFVELGLYVNPGKKKSTPQTVIRVLPERRWETPGLSDLRPDRFLASPASNK